MKKILAISILITIFILVPSAIAYSFDDHESAQSVVSIHEALHSLDMSTLEEYKNQIDDEISPFFENKTVKDWIIGFVRGEWSFDFAEVCENILQGLFKEILANSSLLGKILLLSVLSALLVNLQNSFSSSIAKVSYLACFLALSAIALNSFQIVLNIGHQTIDNMVAFMMAMLPQMVILIAGLGNINTSLMVFPVLMSAATVFANLIKSVVFPLIIMSALLHIINQMSDTVKVARMAKFVSQLAQLSLGFFLTIFVGIVTLRAVYASVLDKVTLRTTKFVTDNAIPVVGKMFSDTIEVAAGYVILLKQAVSIYGVLIIFGIILFPLLKIAAIALIYKIAAAIVEPIGDSRTASVLEIMSTHLFLMLSAVASVGLMFLIMLAMLAGMTNHMMTR
ncbi:Stage III sporulation protein AE [Candidatus Syntrophocurvum alkaliphilum]|uniref:Stage III sporulation protein AE n=1 Tax=Candidatus Syntrophocurvum alkaliphilum TaxID=2293317 RepID=A0A6I6DBY1_9FIRM|nr:stage III sporulation protein AE [Candidatus Syntrophocurvum alkaliphilum]QGT98954.1 Stage III sporulation protein AE [Candidatus Syntrophocurvum alkaliphilum]